MKHGFIRVATAIPNVTVADCEANLSEILRVWKNATDDGAKLVVFPELAITGYTCGDLFLTGTLQAAAERALLSFVESTAKSDTISIIGFPLVVNDKLYNCAAICQKGRILGIVPKTHIPNYSEHKELRYFSSYRGQGCEVEIGNMPVPFGTKIIFACRSLPLFRFGVEICEDLWVACPPSVSLCEAGALLIANPSASAEAVAKEEYRRMLVTSQSAKAVCGYVYADCGRGESTTDMVFGAHNMIAENGKLIAEALPFATPASGYLAAELDLARISSERMRLNTYEANSSDTYQTVRFDMEITETALTRSFPKNPFVPDDAAECVRRCETVLQIQTRGLCQRIEKAYAKTCVIGISGGLDSCLALLVAVRAMDLLGRPRTDVVAVTMPCFGTTTRTRSNAELMCEELGVQLRCIDIADAVKLHFRDIGHDENTHNVVYENAQARERTQILMDVANVENGLVVGTGDLSELALGWATYNGDHMSMYGVNGSVPKTLIRHVVAYEAQTAEKNGQKKLAAVLRDILDTPISPELLPAEEDGTIAQRTEDLVGPYELHDFYLYYMVRLGFAPDKLYRIAKIAFAGEYSDEVLAKWLKNFVRRFFAQQFKRSCLPDGPKVGSLSLSPRGDWSMPSDACAREWMQIADECL